MILDINNMSGEDYLYELWDKDTNTKIDHCVWANDETGEYRIYDTYAAEEMLEQHGPKWNVGGLVVGKLKPIHSRYKHNGENLYDFIHKKGNIEFRKWNATENSNA